VCVCVCVCVCVRVRAHVCARAHLLQRQRHRRSEDCQELGHRHRHARIDSRQVGHALISQVCWREQLLLDILGCLGQLLRGGKEQNGCAGS